MFGLTPWRARQPETKRETGGRLAPYFGLPFEQMVERFFRDMPFETDGWGWRMDVEDKEDAIVVRAEAPGFEPDDFNLEVRGGTLVLKASHKTEKKDEDERSWEQRELYRMIQLPADVDPENVDARYKNGILTVALPKTTTGKGKRIPIKG